MMQTKWFTKSLQEMSETFDINKGLTDAQVEESRQKNGENKLKEIKGRSIWNQIIDQFKDTTIIILGGSGH